MTAGEAAKAATTEATLLAAGHAAHGIVVDDARRLQIKAIAEATGQADDGERGADAARAARTCRRSGARPPARSSRPSPSSCKDVEGRLEGRAAKLRRRYGQARVPPARHRPAVWGRRHGGRGHPRLAARASAAAGRPAGPAQAGVAYQWQENGQEFFVRRASDGSVVTRQALDAAMAAAASAQPAQPSGPVENGHAHQHRRRARQGGRGQHRRTYAAAGARQAVEESNAAFPARQRRLNLLGT